MLLGLAAILVYLYFFVGFEQLFLGLEKINIEHFLLFYSLALASALCGILFFALSWRRLLKALQIEISAAKAFQYHLIANAVDLIVPSQTVGGELIRVQLVYREEGPGNYGCILSSAFVNRILINVIYVFGLSAGVIIILTTHSTMVSYVIGPLMIFLIGTLIYNAVLISMAAKRGTAKKLFTGFVRFIRVISLGRFKGDKLLTRAEGTLLSFETGFQIFREKPRHLIMPAVFLFLSWLASLLSFLFVFYALDYFSLPMDLLLVGFSLAVALQGIMAAFSVGILDIFMTQFLSLYKITIAASSIAVLLVRFVIFWFPIIAGYIVIQSKGARSLLTANPDPDQDKK